MRRAASGALALLLAGCAAAGTGSGTGGPASRPAPGDGTCDASGTQGLVGNTASVETGARLLELSGARTLRWVPPRTAVTMDFRPDRLTVTYDDAMTIETIRCG